MRVQPLFIVAGVSGSGKSWVCRQLESSKDVVYVRHDETPRKVIGQTIGAALRGSRPVLYDPTVKVSTTLKAYPGSRLFVIVEDEGVIQARLAARGGTMTDGIRKRMARMNRLSQRAEFSGTSDQVLAKLLEVI